MTSTQSPDQIDRVRRLVARCTREQLEQIASKLDEDDLAVLTEIMADTLVVEANAFDRVGYTPHPGPQTELHRLASFTGGGPWDVLIGGAMGGGKTLSLIMDQVDKATRHPGYTGWFLRSTYKQLERDVFPYLEEFGWFRSLGASWNANRRELRFPPVDEAPSSKIVFIYARTVAEAQQIRGECQMLSVDERTLIPPDVVDTIALRIRSSSDLVPVYGIRSGTNPGGVGHSRVKEEFIDPAPTGRVDLPIVSKESGQPIVTPSGRPMTRRFIPSTSADNPSLDESYYLTFEMMSADARASYRDGDWSRFEGMRFAGFSPNIHIAEPADWPITELLAYPRGRGIDFGSSAPFACVWGAKVRSDLLVVYREVHQAGLTPTQQAERILSTQLDGEEAGMRAWLDPSTWARNPEQPRAPRRAGNPPDGSIAARYQTAGVPVRKAHNDRVTGWSLLDDLLVVNPDTGWPSIVILATCPNVIRSLTGAPRDETNPEDVDDAYSDDHALDALRYLVMGMFGRRRPDGNQPTNVGARLAGARIPTGVG